MSKTENVAVIVLAAGYGTRMKSKTAKVLHPIAGRPLIEHVLDTSSQLNPQTSIAVLGPHTESIADKIKDHSKIAIQKEALGTGDAVKPALELLKDFEGNVLILYGDTPLLHLETLQNMLDTLNSQDVCVLGFMPADPGAYGRLITDNEKLLKIVEFKEASQKEKEIGLCNSGVIAVRKTVLDRYIPTLKNNNAKGEYYLTDIIELATKDKLHCTYITASEEEEVLGINNRIELAEAENILQERLRKKAMLGGASMIDPSSVFLSYDTEIGQDVLIEPHVYIGTGVTIADGSHIKSYSHIEKSSIGEDCTIGPFARIRPSTTIESGAKVGNFVEIKNSTLHKNVKAGHLTYIGDSEVGEESNIGAGTITCNYDGVNKHKTTIGKGCFIGSNSALVAPVSIGDHAFVAAGSTITKEVQADSLAIVRSDQKEIKNWSKKRPSSK